MNQINFIPDVLVLAMHMPGCVAPGAPAAPPRMKHRTGFQSTGASDGTQGCVWTLRCLFNTDSRVQVKPKRDVPGCSPRGRSICFAVSAAAGLALREVSRRSRTAPQTSDPTQDGNPRRMAPLGCICPHFKTPPRRTTAGQC